MARCLELRLVTDSSMLPAAASPAGIDLVTELSLLQATNPAWIGSPSGMSCRPG